jgi:glycosyltransferase involved in cell wall biosynthesis
VVCTRNRASDLTDVLAGLQSQRVHPELRWEIIVVDNGSTDDTTTVVKDYAQRAPVEVRCIREREPGLSGARNRGWRESEADVVAFLDDDCVPDPVWLQSLVDAYDAPEVASVGGRLFPLIDPDEREKIDAAWLSVYTFDAGDSPRDIEILTGANMSFRRRVLERTGGFDEQLGRIGQCLLAGDENDLCRAIRREGAGWRILYQPEAVARHKLRPANLSDALLIKRDYCGGITNAILDRKERAGRRFILRLLRMAKRFVAALRGARHRFPGAEKSPLREIARRQEFVGYRREQSGGIELACKDCPMRPQRERRLEVLASRSAARPASSASAREDAASSEKRNS